MMSKTSNPEADQVTKNPETSLISHKKSMLAQPQQRSNKVHITLAYLMTSAGFSFSICLLVAYLFALLISNTAAHRHH